MNMCLGIDHLIGRDIILAITRDFSILFLIHLTRVIMTAPIEIGVNGETTEMIIIIEKIGHKEDILLVESVVGIFLPIIIETRIMTISPEVGIITANIIMGTETHKMWKIVSKAAKGIIKAHIIKHVVGVAELGMQPPANIHIIPLYRGAHSTKFVL